MTQTSIPVSEKKATVVPVVVPGETYEEPTTKEVALFEPTGYGGFTNKQIAILKATAFKECKTMEQVAMACCLAKHYDLDPFAKEIWAMPMKSGLTIEASAAGWRKIIRRQEKFKRMVINPWYESDEIQFDHLNGKLLKHIETATPKGEPLGAYCFVEYTDGTFNLARALWSEYGQPGKKQGRNGEYDTVWKFAQEMIKNKAAAIFGRTYCGVSGLYSAGEVPEEMEKPKELSGEEKMQALREKHDKKKTEIIDMP